MRYLKDSTNHEYRLLDARLHVPEARSFPATPSENQRLHGMPIFSGRGGHLLQQVIPTKKLSTSAYASVLLLAFSPPAIEMVAGRLKAELTQSGEQKMVGSAHLHDNSVSRIY